MATATTLSNSTITTVVRPDATRLYTEVSGEGPTVVLAHGFLDDHVGFVELGNRLVRAGRRVVLFDQRGHGSSSTGTDGLVPRAMAGDYAAILEHYGVKDGVLVGHSMGGFLSVAFSIFHAEVARERLRGLVLVGAHAGEVATGSPQNQVQIAMIQAGIMGLLQGSRRAMRAMARSLYGDVADPAWVEDGVQIFMRADFPQTLPILKAQIRESFYARLGEIPVPAVVICGEKDRTCPRFHSERLGARIPGSRNVWLPRIGHMVNREQPDAILDAVEDHLRQPARA